MVKITNSPVPDNDTIAIDKIVIKYWQDGNSVDGTEDGETLEVEFKNAALDSDSWFMSLKTGKEGFSINEPNDLLEILQDACKRSGLMKLDEK